MNSKLLSMALAGAFILSMNSCLKKGDYAFSCDVDGVRKEVRVFLDTEKIVAEKACEEAGKLNPLVTDCVLEEK